MLKTLLKVHFASIGASLFRNRKKAGVKSGKGRTVLIGLLTLYVIACFFIMFGSMFYSLCAPLHELGLGWFYFAIAGLLAFALSFIGNIFATQTQLYDARDNELLLSLPIKPKFILGSRMLALLALDLLYILLVMLPAGVVYCMNYSAGAVGVIYFVIECLLLPLMVQAFSCVFAWLLSVISNRMRNKTTVTMVCSVAFLVVYFYAYSKIGDIINELVTNGTEIAVAVKRAVFPAYYFGVGIAEHNLTYLLLFTVCVLALFELIYWILSRSFLRIATTKKGAARIRYREKRLQVSSPRRALLKKDLRHFWGNAMYVLNAWLGQILLLIATGALLLKRDLVETALLTVGGGTELTAPILCVAVCGISTTNLIAAPSVSLEGKNLWIAQSIPVRGRDILLAKAEMQMVLCLPITAVCSFLLGLLLALTWQEILMLVLLPAVFNIMLALMGVTIGLQHPKFDYLNETVVIKQSAATVLCMFIGFAAVLVPALLYALLLSRWIESGIYLIICCAVFAAIAAVLYRYLCHAGEQRFLALQAD